MLKLKLPYFGHLMGKTDSLEDTMMLGKTEAGGEGDDRGWDGWMASPTQQTWVWASSRCWWWPGKPGTLQSMGSQSQIRLSNWTTREYLTLLHCQYLWNLTIILMPIIIFDCSWVSFIWISHTEFSLLCLFVCSVLCLKGLPISLYLALSHCYLHIYIAVLWKNKIYWSVLLMVYISMFSSLGILWIILFRIFLHVFLIDISNYLHRGRTQGLNF